MRVYHFVNKEYGLENLRKKRLKIATLNELNDPFELFGVEFSDPDTRRAFRVMKDDMSKNRGLMCFSKGWQNPVQWSHYADKHKGLCLGFDVPDEYLGEVNYSRSRLIADVEKLRNPKDLSLSLAKKFLFTKYHHWKYENEVRSFVTLEEIDEEKGLYFAGFSEQLTLREVIVGAMSDITRNDINENLGGIATNVRSWKARLAFRTFKVVKQNKSELWV